MRRPVIVVTVAVLALVAGLMTAPASAASWSSFTAATFTNIALSPSIASGTTSYTFGLLPGAQVDGMDVDAILGFFVVGDPQSSTFTATGSDDTGWNFDSKTNPGYMAGWEATGAGYFVPVNGSKTLSFNSFTINSGGAIAGFHLRYTDVTGASNTAYFKGNAGPSTNENPVVPEPSALALGLLGGSGAAVLGAMRRRLASAS